ncbi:MAG: hypothetical protein A2284_11090 [Deltaproteobacteria bacterium RIFOXYA12_FULL_61_11]|nr:MAG: hypothetical protein A2284_11090 [Deltaproteobacteria bacterium RIFOXYA12_FULL_61_11]
MKLVLVLLPLLLTCTKDPAPTSHGTPKKGNGDIPATLVDRLYSEEDVTIVGDGTVGVNYSQREVNPWSGGSGEPGAETVSVAILELELTSGAILALPASALPPKPQLEAKDLDDEALNDALEQAGIDLDLPGLIEASKLLGRVDTASNATLLAAVEFGITGQTVFENTGVDLALPASALPAAALPSSALPASALPSSALPASALPSSLVAENTLGLSALPTSALPASALPSSYFLHKTGILKFQEADSSGDVQLHDVSEDGQPYDISSDQPLVEALLTCSTTDLGLLVGRCPYLAAPEDTSSDNAHFSCSIDGQLASPSCQILVFAFPGRGYIHATLQGVPLLLVKERIDLDANTPPLLTMAEHYKIEAGAQSYLLIEAEDPDPDLLRASCTDLPGYAVLEHHRLLFTPAEAEAGTNLSLELTVWDNGNPNQEVTQTITVMVVAPPSPPDPPETMFDVTPDTGGTFSFHSTQPGATFQCELDKLGFEVCESPKSYSGLTFGEHTFLVYAIDVAGVKDPSPASWTWEIIPTDGLLNSAPRLTAACVTQVYVDSTYTCQVVSEDSEGDTVTLTPVDFPGNMILDQAGLITWTPPNSMVGEHTFSVEGVDSQGASAYPLTVTLTVLPMGDGGGQPL